MNSNKVGIVTLFPKENYGGILQCISMQAAIKSLGYDPVIIKREFKHSAIKKIAFLLFEYLPFQNFRGVKSRKIKAKQFKSFINKKLDCVTEDIFYTKDLEHIVNKYRLSTLIVGSDQVWRYSYINDGNYQSFFLKANVDIKKISYAASFGHDYWEAEKEINNVSKLLDEFDSISVRENSGVEVCKSTFGVENAIKVLDPTLLLGKEFFLEFIKKTEINKCQVNNLVSYTLDSSTETKEIIDVLIKKSNEQSEEKINFTELNEKLNGRYILPDEWVKIISMAKFLITDSFHGVCFSIIFNVPFAVKINERRGSSRFMDLLIPLGLESRIVRCVSDISSVMHSKVDWNKVNERLEKDRVVSLKYLKESLEN